MPRSMIFSGCGSLQFPQDTLPLLFFICHQTSFTCACCQKDSLKLSQDFCVLNLENGSRTLQTENAKDYPSRKKQRAFS